MDVRSILEDEGYVVLAGFMTAELLAELRRSVDTLWEQEGSSAGGEFRTEEGARRLANLVNKGEVFRRIIGVPEILRCVCLVLGPSFKLSSLNARSVNPGWSQNQPLHCDMGALPDERGFWVCNTVWLLDDFTPSNGPIRIVPGTHRSGRTPQEVLEDPCGDVPAQRLITGKAGDVIVMNAHLWHGGTANRTEIHRRAVHGFYVRRDKPQQQYQRGLLDLPLQRRLSPAERYLLALDDAQNDRISQETPGMSGFLR